MAIDLDFYGNSVHFHSIKLWAFEKGHLQSWQLDVEGSSTCDKGHSFARELWFMSLSNSLSAFLTVEWVHCSGGRSSSLGQLQEEIEQEWDGKGKQKREREREREREDGEYWALLSCCKRPSKTDRFHLAHEADASGVSLSLSWLFWLVNYFIQHICCIDAWIIHQLHVATIISRYFYLPALMCLLKQFKVFPSRFRC